MPKKGEFWDWWGGITLAEKILFGIWAAIESITLIFMVLIGLDTLGVLP